MLNSRLDKNALMQDIEDWFKLPDLIHSWPVILDKYKTFGFNDRMTDQDMIEEFNYIIEQYRKFVFSHQAQILSKKDNLYEMRDIVDDLISKSAEKDLQRKKLVYISLRDDWLFSLRNKIEYIIELIEEGD